MLLRINWKAPSKRQAVEALGRRVSKGCQDLSRFHVLIRHATVIFSTLS